MKKVDKRATALAKPIPGQSHWCDGWTADDFKCMQIVLNTSNHCEAGHKNEIRPITTAAVTTKTGLQADSDSYEVEEA